jgi:hypothetical protein
MVVFKAFQTTVLLVSIKTHTVQPVKTRDRSWCTTPELYSSQAQNTACKHALSRSDEDNPFRFSARGIVINKIITRIHIPIYVFVRSLLLDVPMSILINYGLILDAFVGK